MLLPTDVDVETFAVSVVVVAVVALVVLTFVPVVVVDGSNMDDSTDDVGSLVCDVFIFFRFLVKFLLKFICMAAMQHTLTLVL